MLQVSKLLVLSFLSIYALVITVDVFRSSWVPSPTTQSLTSLACSSPVNSLPVQRSHPLLVHTLELSSCDDVPSKSLAPISHSLLSCLFFISHPYHICLLTQYDSLFLCITALSPSISSNYFLVISLSMWNGLNVYVPLKFICWNRNPHGDGINRWGTWSVIRSWGKVFMNWISALLKDTPEKSLSLLPCEVKVRRRPSNRKWTQSLLMSWSWTFQPPELWEIHFCCL